MVVRGWLEALPAAELARRCGSRCVAHRLHAHPSVIADVLAEPGVVPGGVSAAGNYPRLVDVVAPGEGELYASARVLAPLVRRFALIGSDRPNVIVRVPAGPAWPFDPGAAVAPLAVVGVDLLEAAEPRSRRAGQRIVDSLRARRP